MLFAGWVGIAVSIALFVIIWVIAWSRTDGELFTFEQKDEDFEKQLIVYLDITKFILTLAAGGIVLIISSTALAAGKSRLPPGYASPLFILVMSIFYGIIFMPLLALNYESFKHSTHSYSKFRYVRNQTLGFSALACFCLGYGWLIVAAIRG